MSLAEPDPPLRSIAMFPSKPEQRKIFVPRKGAFRFALLFRGLRREVGPAGALAESYCLFVAVGLSPRGLAKCKLSLGLLKGGEDKVFIIGASSGSGEKIAAASCFC